MCGWSWPYRHNCRTGRHPQPRHVHGAAWVKPHCPESICSLKHSLNQIRTLGEVSPSFDVLSSWRAPQSSATVRYGVLFYSRSCKFLHLQTQRQPSQLLRDMILQGLPSLGRDSCLRLLDPHTLAEVWGRTHVWGINKRGDLFCICSCFALENTCLWH